MCFDGTPLYETKSKTTGISFQDKSIRFEFARSAIQKLREKCPEALVDGLVRVDIMVNDNGSMIVNEFESLEAGHQPSSRDERQYSVFTDKMTNYYYNIILSLVNQFLNK